ncbi:MAG TPA: hypothetical protein VLX90_15850, partial [Steroidobacteraceae bacterium]|nr:hypothetical protein [Steroidobacteraceae bacterium]
WREIYEDESLRLRRLPDGLDFKLVVEARPVVLSPTGDPKSQPTEKRPQAKSLKDVTSLKDATTPGRGLEDDTTTLKDAKAVMPQIMIFSNGDLTSFEVTLEREGAMRSVTLAQDEKGQFVEKPLVEGKT